MSKCKMIIFTWGKSVVSNNFTIQEVWLYNTAALILSKFRQLLSITVKTLHAFQMNFYTSFTKENLAPLIHSIK